MELSQLSLSLSNTSPELLSLIFKAITLIDQFPEADSQPAN